MITFPCNTPAHHTSEAMFFGCITSLGIVSVVVVNIMPHFRGCISNIPPWDMVCIYLLLKWQKHVTGCGCMGGIGVEVTERVGVVELMNCTSD